MEKVLTNAPKIKKRRLNPSRVRESLELYVLLLIPVAMLFFLSYMPMPGIAVAFQDYKLGQDGIWADNAKWVGFKHFTKFIEGRNFKKLMGNTLRISIKNLFYTFWIPIGFALLLNEIKHMQTKKIVQTITYMPHFISTVVVAGMVTTFCQSDGLIGQITGLLGDKPTNILQNANNFDAVYLITLVWISFGFDSILYMSAISGIDQELYEAARLDGASRWQQMWYITLPGILPTISITLIMALGSILGTNTDMILNLYSPANYSKSDCIGTYVYREGIGDNGSGGGKYSATAAIGLFSAVINITLLFIANKLSNWLTDTGLW